MNTLTAYNQEYSERYELSRTSVVLPSAAFIELCLVFRLVVFQLISVTLLLAFTVIAYRSQYEYHLATVASLQESLTLSAIQTAVFTLGKCHLFAFASFERCRCTFRFIKSFVCVFRNHQRFESMAQLQNSSGGGQRTAGAATTCPHCARSRNTQDTREKTQERLTSAMESSVVRD